MLHPKADRSKVVNKGCSFWQKYFCKRKDSPAIKKNWPYWTHTILSYRVRVVIIFLIFSTGIGGSLVFVPGTLSVGAYFDRHRPVATGTASSGGGVGGVLFPPLMSELLQRYGLFGCLLVVAALQLHHCVSALLYRPIHVHLREKISKDKNNNPAVNTASGTSGNDNSRTKTKHKSGKQLLDVTLLMNRSFRCYVVCMFFFTVCTSITQMLLPGLAEASGATEWEAAILLSMMAAADSTSRFLSGVFFDRSLVMRFRGHLYSATMFVSGVASLGMASTRRSYPSLVAMCLVHGMFAGTAGSQRPVMIADLLGVLNIPSALSMTVFSQGLAMCIGPAMAGKGFKW